MAGVPLLIFCPNDFSIGVSVVLKLPTNTVLLLISFYGCYHCLIYWGVTIVLSFSLYSPLDHYLVSFLDYGIKLYLKIYFVLCKYCYSGFFFLVYIYMEYFFPPLSLSLCMSLDLKWISCRQHIWVYFCAHSPSLCFLAEAFNQFTFKMNYQYACSYWDFLNCFGFIFLGCFSSLSLLFPSLMIWWLILVLYFGYFFFVCVCVYPL